MLIKMSLRGLSLDPSNNYPIAILKDAKEKYILPVWINIFEASQILHEVERVDSPRPLTHSLLMKAISRLGGKVEKVVFNDVQQNVFYCSVHLKKRGCVLDASPSDAIMLALKADVPIWVDTRVIEKSRVLDFSVEEAGSLKHKEKINSLLDHIYLSDNIKYKI